MDENITKCGKYAYCWPRDAVFVTRALDILNMTKETEKFYKVFCKNTQSENGMWEQRFYTDGKLAPCWGYQIDETASVIYGVNEHYKKTKEIKFLKDTLKMCEKATRFLFIYMDNILGTRDESDVVKNEIEETYHTKEREKLPISYDIWEMKAGSPPQTEEEAETLAKEQFAFCYDIVMQAAKGWDRIRALASTLKNSSAWYFWWD